LKLKHYIKKGQQELQVQNVEGDNVVVQTFKYDPEVSLKKFYKAMIMHEYPFSATMDMWTSNQNKGYMCITIHWVDDTWQMQKRIICLPHVKGHHRGELLATEFIKGVMSWNLEKSYLLSP
jgi:hypothetical protein